MSPIDNAGDTRPKSPLIPATQGNAAAVIGNKTAPYYAENQKPVRLFLIPFPIKFIQAQLRQQELLPKMLLMQLNVLNHN